jgi:hypothetical protein
MRQLRLSTNWLIMQDSESNYAEVSYHLLNIRYTYFIHYDILRYYIRYWYQISRTLYDIQSMNIGSYLWCQAFRIYQYWIVSYLISNINSNHRGWIHCNISYDALIVNNISRIDFPILSVYLVLLNSGFGWYGYQNIILFPISI